MNQFLIYRKVSEGLANSVAAQIPCLWDGQNLVISKPDKENIQAGVSVILDNCEVVEVGLV